MRGMKNGELKVWKVNESETIEKSHHKLFRCATYHICVFKVTCAEMCKCDYMPFPSRSAELPNKDSELKKDATFYSTLLHGIIASVENIISSWSNLKRIINCIGFDV